MSRLATVPPSALRPAAIGMMAALCLSAAPWDAEAGEILVAASNLPPGVLIEPDHLFLADGQPVPGVLSNPKAAIGLESRVSLYKGRPIRAADLGPPTLVRRNAIVNLVFRRGPLEIRTDGRALDQGGMGDRIRIMNLDSRRTVFATIAGPNLVEAK